MSQEKKYSPYNPARYPDEPQEVYKARRSFMNKLIDLRIKYGEPFWLSHLHGTYNKKIHNEPDTSDPRRIEDKTGIVL